MRKMAAQICLLSALNKRARSLKEEEEHGQKHYPHQLVVVVVSSAELEREKGAFAFSPLETLRERKRESREVVTKRKKSGLRLRND
jgi:hypothetical protein